MVGLLLAGLLGWYFLSRRTGGNIITPATAQPIMSNNGPNPATAPPGSVINGISYGADGKPLTTDIQGINYEGTFFVTKESSAGQLAAMSGATGYDLNNPQVAKDTLNALYVADTATAYDKANTAAYNAANGTSLTVDQYKALQAQIKSAQIATSEYVASQQVASQNGTTDPPTPSPGPGYYWNYVFQGWMPFPPGTVTAPTTETRSGRGHF